MPTRRFILGTAGHVDHGKTQLVKRLTGWDTDRLKEEKARGISIELGFAPLQLDDDVVIGIVDVPGHEKFVKHMVAGAGGIDLAILVVAADEGVMPQTQEHMEVLRSLGVAHGVIAVTKSDLVADDMRELVEDDIRELVAGSFLETAPVVYTSAKTGDGMDALKATLLELTAQLPERDSAGPFRLAVDRIFHKQGIGAVVTGSCYSGTVSMGDTLELLPAGKRGRVRDLQSFGGKREQGFAGERLAIALQGLKLEDVARGDMLVTPGTFQASYMIDARLHVARYAPFEIKARERIRLHHGAREVLGRIALLEGEVLRSGDDALVQFRLESPIVAGRGDFFVIRKYSPQRVLGGGRIIDPAADKHKLSDASVLDDLHLQEQGDPVDQTAKLIIDAALAGVAAGELDTAHTEALLEKGAARRIGKRVYAAGTINALAGDIERLAAEYVAAYPLRRGIDKEELRQRTGFAKGVAVFNSVLEEIARTSPVTIQDNLVMAGAGGELPQQTQQQLDAVREFYRQAGALFPRNDDAARVWRGDADFNDALLYLRAEGDVVRLADDAYMHRDGLRQCVAAIRQWFADNDELSVADFKDLFGMSRKHAIPILEYTDQARITLRRDNARVAGPRLSDAASG